MDIKPCLLRRSATDRPASYGRRRADPAQPRREHGQDLGCPTRGRTGRAMAGATGEAEYARGGRTRVADSRAPWGTTVRLPPTMLQLCRKLPGYSAPTAQNGCFLRSSASPPPYHTPTKSGVHRAPEPLGGGIRQKRLDIATALLREALTQRARELFDPIGSVRWYSELGARGSTDGSGRRSRNKRRLFLLWRLG